MKKENKTLSIEELSKDKKTYKIEDGENKVVICVSKGVRFINSKFGERYVFEIIKDGKVKDMIVSEYLMRLIVSKISLSVSENPEIVILKERNGEKVKYSVSVNE